MTAESQGEKSGIWHELVLITNPISITRSMSKKSGNSECLSYYENLSPATTDTWVRMQLFPVKASMRKNSTYNFYST